MTIHHPVKIRPTWAREILRGFICTPEELAPKPSYVLKTRTDDGLACYLTDDTTPTLHLRKAIFFLLPHQAKKVEEKLHRKGRVEGSRYYSRVMVQPILPHQYN